MTTSQLAARRSSSSPSSAASPPAASSSSSPTAARTRFGPGGAAHGARSRSRDPRAWPALLRGSRGLAEAYVDGFWDTPDLVGVVRVAARNVQAPRRAAPAASPRCARPTSSCAGLRGRTTRTARATTSTAHYDLGNDLFELMLDDTMMYSAGYFATPETSLRDASIAKLELVCEKLDLGPERPRRSRSARAGAGSPIHAATTRGCRVTTTTISREQHASPSSACARPASPTASPSCSRTTATCAASTTRSSRSR